MSDKNWLVYQLPEILADISPTSVAFKEFLRTPSMSCAVYQVPAGSREMQSAHEEDELYFIVEGKGHLRVGDEEHVVTRGTLMYVCASCDHTFFDVEEDITALAFFGTVCQRP